VSEEREGNTGAPRAEPDERSADGRPRRAGDARREHEADRRQREAELGTSWTSVILGWLAALGAGLILSGLVSGIVGAIFGSSGRQGATEGGASALIGLLITLLLAFMIGGYVAGRLASRSGLKHGLLVPVLALVVTVVLAGIGTLLGLSFIDNLSGVTLPQLPQDAPQSLGTIFTVTGILALLVPFIGGALGGARGAKTGRHRP
jgi:hypothetical protein